MDTNGSFLGKMALLLLFFSIIYYRVEGSTGGDIFQKSYFPFFERWMDERPFEFHAVWRWWETYRRWKYIFLPLRWNIYINVPCSWNVTHPRMIFSLVREPLSKNPRYRCFLWFSSFYTRPFHVSWDQWIYFGIHIFRLKEKSIQKEKRIKSKNFESNSVRFISVEIDKSIKYNNIKNILWKNEKENGREKEINSQVWRSICEGSLEQKEIVRRKYSKIRIIIGYLEKTNAACKNLIYREQVEFSRKKGSLLFRPITCASIIARPSRQTFNLSTRDAW